jgi:hypothetical protein
MEESSARARLVDSTGNGATVLTTLPRREFESALQIDGGPPDLILDVTRYAGEGETKTSTTGQVSVSWAREDLEEILRRSEGDTVTIGFDADALLRSLDPEVEAHGVREVAAVLAAAVVAGSAAGAAAAQPDQGTGASTAGTAAVVQTDYGVPRAMPSDYAAQPDQYGAPRAMPSDYAAQPDEYGAPRAMPSDYAAQPAEYGMPRAMPSDYAQPTGDGGIHVTLPSPETTGAIVGAFALLITGAAFAAKSRRRVTPAT